MAIKVLSVGSVPKYMGASTDTKPTIASHSNLPQPAQGSTFFVHDTQAMYITYDGTNWVLKDAMGEIQATPTAYTLLRRVKDILTGTILAAGAARIGTVSGVCKTVAAATKELAAAGAYAAEDVLSESVDAGTVWTFSAIFRANNTGGYITKAQAICERTAVTPRLTLFLFNAAPTCNLHDNVANTALVHADESQYVGKIDFPALEDLGGDSEATVTPSTVGGEPLWVDAASAADDLIGVLVTRDALTLTAADEMILKLTLEQY